jgi:hypothetical protein
MIQSAELQEPSPQPNILKISEAQPGFELTAARQVLQLKDTLDLIISHIPNETRTGRRTISSASLVNRSFRESAQKALWSAPIQLDTVMQQVQFAFGCYLTLARGKGLGSQVKDLSIRWPAAEGNFRVLRAIAFCCPNVTALLIRRGNTGDKDRLTSESIASTHSFLSSFPHLRKLEMCKFSYTPSVKEKFDLHPDAHVPFSKLDYFRIFGFSWLPYWPAIANGLGKTLTHLVFHDEGVPSEEITFLADKFPNLLSLELFRDVDLPTLRTFFATAKKLKRVGLNLPIWEGGPGAIDGAIDALASLIYLEDIHICHYLSIEQVYALASCPHPLKSFSIQLDDPDEVPLKLYENCIVAILEKKKTTLTHVCIMSRGSLPPTIALVKALASLRHLVMMNIWFSAPLEPLPSFEVDALLTSCENLEWSYALDVLTKGNFLYEKRYKERLERDTRDKKAEYFDTLPKLG